MKEMKKIKIWIRTFILFFFFVGIEPSTNASCQGRIINPVTDICWKCLFPITIGLSGIGSSHLPDTQNSRNPICICKWKPLPQSGIAMGYWEPMGLVDVTRIPYCLVNLGGAQIFHKDASKGVVETQTPDEGGSFYEVHYYNFPIMKILVKSLLGGSCHTDGQFALTYMSELDPTWHDESLAAIVFPETQSFANPVDTIGAHAACAYDSIKADIGLADDFAFWCAGSQGFMYPLTGKVVEHVGSIQASTLLVERLIFKLHRLGRISDTDRNHLCKEHTDLIMKKSRYRYQMVYPHAKACQPFGRTTMIWSASQINPLRGDDTAFLIWRKRNCCEY